MTTRKRSAPYSPERVVELETAIAYLRARQEAKPKRDTHGRMVLAVLISAFERRLDLTRAALDRSNR